MASSFIKFDIPATYMRSFSLDQQRAIQRLLAYYEGAGLTQALVAADGALAVNAYPAVVTKGSAALMTLAAPTSAQNGTVKVITSNTNFAHTITATGLFQNGVAGGAKNTATFAAFAGASITVMAYEGKWNVVALNAVTVA